MCKFIKIRHDVIKQCRGNCKEMKKFNYKLEIEIFRNSTQKNVGVLRCSFQGFGYPKRHPDTLLAKAMLCGSYGCHRHEMGARIIWVIVDISSS